MIRKYLLNDIRKPWPTITGEPHLDKINTGIIKVQKYLNVNDQMILIEYKGFDFFDIMDSIGGSI